MNREYHRWYSPSLQRDMELLIFGHAGAKLLVFPTSRGRFYEWEDRDMMRSLGHQIEQGWLQVYCLDSVDAESWYARWKHPGARAWRQVEYENYILREVLPLAGQKNNNPFLITVGASFGAYHALTMALRHPHIFSRAIGLSGIYDIRGWTDGHHDETIYFNNPVEFIPNEHDWGRLEALRRLDIILVAGQDDRLRYSSEELSAALWHKGIGNALRIWDGWAHDWPYWQQMLNMYVSGHD
jgi:esterase/lipase superfamily enzyme